ncbi:MAG: 3'-5' exonuclease [Deltaproteobacteria bacterium]|nr:3'-5' exonuclease [Deltaproteobacteria bacterium]
MNRICAVDVETTGLSVRKGHRVIEVGAVIIEEGRLSRTFHSLVSAGKPVSASALAVHGITEEMLAGEPSPEEVYPELARFMEGCRLVAHNARFDMDFLRSEFDRQDIPFNPSCDCTLILSRKGLPHLPDHRLMTVYKHFFGKIPDNVQLHRALADARLAAEVWLKLQK